MREGVRGQQPSMHKSKDFSYSISRTTHENILENSSERKSNQNPEAFKRKNPEKALGLARDVCVLANAGQAAEDKSPDVQPRVVEAVKLLEGAGWRFADLDSKGPDALYPRVPGGPKERAIAAVVVECRRFATQLASLIAIDALIIEQPATAVWLDRKTGKLHEVQFRPLGPYQDALARVLKHRGIDLRRFVRCQVCQAFFYQPRLSSRACSDKCVNVLMSREHYVRVKQAKELKGQGKSLPEIARDLGLKLGQARKYLSAKEK